MNALALDDLRPRKPDRLSRGAVLALIAHALLVLALSLGVNWRTSEPAGVEAELWAAVPQAAAPRAVEPEPPKPAPPEPKPEPKPQPEAKVEPPPNRDAEIAREKREQKEIERQRLEDEKREADKKKEAEEKQRDEQQAKLEADKKKKADEKRLAQQAEAFRKQQMERVLGQAGATGAPTDTGTAAQSAGPSANYAGRIKARIKPNIVFGDEVATNPVASVQVRVAPDGTIMGRQLVKSSGIASWDDAVLRAIDKTETLPRDTDGRVPPSMVIDFRPRDF